ncbi:PREDICTED: transmembrane protein 140 [Gavialis gangeticus]|uniref:transmembrane protein 140 n=1 Tax=Gavialis gangeticus TaxID=94835 RepID=UPI00092F97B3|nr:PREDICTED: transmembrane protein 140 [Gavialis gangeticus]XP_019370511.1 PREDICTED: transmembrane protein 140 [Gavialis gangeticus]XP_019370512.1 PREDICTED: transmembrane protein 140 [Gavialis gangeticus]XP_019370513.1 PREDICTED: transmembrane protein 140 [Gavialis gangeticus]
MVLFCQKKLMHLLHLIIFFLAVGSVALMVYALLVEAGNIVNLPKKRIGFYNFCLWNETIEELQCLMIKDFEKIDIHQAVIAVARVLVYSPLIICLFSLHLIVHVGGSNDRMEWELILMMLGTTTIMLSGGLSLFLFQVWTWIQVSDFSGAFIALAGAQVLLVLQLVATATYLKWVKDNIIKGSSSPEEELPPLKV